MNRNNFIGKYPILIIIVSVLITSSCKTSQTAVDLKDLSYLYNPIKNSVNPKLAIFNQSDETSVLSVKFFNSDLFFSEANPSGTPMALTTVSVRLFNISQGKVLADTALYNLEIVKEITRDEYLYNIPLKVEKGFEYMAEVKVIDRIRSLIIQMFVPFNTLSDYNRYNFYARGHVLHNILLNPIVRQNEFFNLLYLKNPADSLFISFFKLFEEIPYPPSMIVPEKTMDYEPDTIVGLPYSDTLPMMFPRKGIFLCSVKRDINEGYTLLNFGTSFPSMRTPEEMIEPLAYLASEDEMAELRSSIKPKVLLDDFWIKCGGNVEKARELIRIFYTRTLYANYYFSSFKEGWRTERGMIYIIYGPPDKLYKSSDEEKWGYRKPVIKSTWGTRYSIKEDYIFFTFKKRENRFSDNEYYLSRSESPVTYWDMAILSWRKGIVFRLDNPSDI